MIEDYKISGMSCANCAKTITKSVKTVPGVKKVKVSLSLNTMHLEKEEDVNDEEIVKAVKKVGYGAQKTDGLNDLFDHKMSKDMKVNIIKFSLSLVLSIPLIVSMFLMIGNVNTLGAKVIGSPIFGLALATIMIFGIGYHFFVDIYTSLRTRTTTMSLLIVVGVLAAYGLSLYSSIMNDWKYAPMSKHELYYETIGVIITLAFGGDILEDLAKKNTTSSLKKISELIPTKTTIFINNEEKNIQTSELKLKDLVVLKPGNKIPTDGVVVKGEGYTNEALVTGESKPIKKEINSNVVAGSILEQGALTFEVSVLPKDNTIAKIVDLVANAQTSQLKIGQLVDKIATWFIPVIFLVALLTFGGWAIWGPSDNHWETAIIRAISVVIVSCPCALALATPTAIMVGTGKASQTGIIFKNGNQLENLAQLKSIVFDKTGTLTEGKMSLDQIINLSSRYSDEELKKYIKAIEINSQHPIAISLVKSLESIPTLEANYFENITSKGVQGVVNSQVVKIGNLAWLSNDPDIIEKVNQLQQEGKIVFLLQIEDEIVGIISLSDKLKKGAKEMVEAFNKLNINAVLLTGDSHLTANYVAQELGIKTIYSEVPVTKKADYIKELQTITTIKNKTKHQIVAMVGDGINDTVALTQADIGIAMNDSIDAAIASSDVILINNDLMDIYRSVVVAKKTYNKIKGNIVWVFAYNFIAVALAAWILPPEIAAILMALSSVFVVVNSLLLKIPKGSNYVKKTKTEKKIASLKIKELKQDERNRHQRTDSSK